MPDSESRRDLSREARRAQIVSVARSAFLDRGYAATSMSTIAAKIGGSKSTLWAYFSSKPVLFSAVMDDVTASFRLNLDGALQVGRDCHTTLLDFSERLLLERLKPDNIRFLRLIIGEGDRFPEIGRMFFARGPQVLVEELSAYLLDRMMEGDLRVDDPRQAAMNLIQLTQMQHHLGLWGVDCQPDSEQVRRHLVKALDVFMRAYAP